MNEKPPVSSNVLQIVIIVVLICNLAGTMALLVRSNQTSTQIDQSNRNDPLPEQLSTSEEKVNLANLIISAYNNRDMDSLYNMLDPVVQNQLTKASLAQNVNSLWTILGKVNNSAYSNYEVTANSQGSKQYRLYYSVNAENGRAVLIITIGQQGNEHYRLYGWIFNKI